jgi:cytochrome b561
MTSIEDDPGADAWFNLHKSIGLVVFALVLLRIGWRLGHRPQPLPASMPRWQVLAASAVQWLLNACLLLLPVTGFLGASYTRSGVVFFGLHLPAWRAPDHDTAELLFSVHQALGWILVWLVTVHLLAALKHLLLDRDRVFQRMWF